MLLYPVMRIKSLKLFIFSLFPLINEVFLGVSLLLFSPPHPVLWLPFMDPHWRDKALPWPPMRHGRDWHSWKKWARHSRLSAPSSWCWVVCRGLMLSSDVPALTLIWASPSTCRRLTLTKEGSMALKTTPFCTLSHSLSFPCVCVSVFIPHLTGLPIGSRNSLPCLQDQVYQMPCPAFLGLLKVSSPRVWY